MLLACFQDCRAADAGQSRLNRCRACGRPCSRSSLIPRTLKVCDGPFFYFLSERFKVPGVIAALIIAQCFRVTLFYIISQRALYLNYEKASLFGLLLISGALVFISMQLNKFVHHLLMVLISAGLLIGYLHFSKLFTLSRLKKNSQIAQESHHEKIII